MLQLFHNKKVRLGIKLNELGINYQGKIADNQILDFFNLAHQLSINYFDTSPSYGASEILLGKFLSTLSAPERKDLIVATKFGEHWNKQKKEKYVDHSFRALITSIENSLNRLGRIDILQLHRTNPLLLKSPELTKVLEFAQKKGVKVFGACADDLESAQMICEDKNFSFIRFPFNFIDQTFNDIFEIAGQNKKYVVVNHPLNTGWLLTEQREGLDEKAKIVNAFKFILQKKFTGFVLTDTSSVSRLKQNYEAFKEASG